MSAIWFAIPSARPAAEADPVLERWQAQGYRVAVLRQGEAVKHTDVHISTPTYKGWAASINYLCRFILERDAETQFIVSGGDDTLPDPDHTAEEIAHEITEHFGDTFSVTQPTGDLRAWPNSRIDHFAGSPWLGREWCRRMYGGAGPMFAGYPHCWADEELMQVAIKLGVFWQRPDLVHRHEHFLRDKRPKPTYADMIGRDYGDSRALFEQRRAAGWPGHEPIA